MIESPPKISRKELAKAFFTPNKALTPLTQHINEKYEYWSDVKYKTLPEGVTAEQLWASVKAARITNRKMVWDKYEITLSVTDQMQRMCHNFDMNFGGSWGANSIIPEQNKEQYLINSLMEEAISSSQMEGASTTRKIAKEMLEKKITPRDKSQQMISNNYRTIQFIAENKNEPLTVELFLKVHALMTEGTLEQSTYAGKFRDNNNVVVEDGITHTTVHTPPSFKEIPDFIETLCHFFNEEKAKAFIHPIIRGIIIHFMIAYVHPFVDGNGRTARALFYWYMLKQGYWLTEYLSISKVISKSKKMYEKSYLYTECDEKDMGYFVYYNLRVLDLAFNDLKEYIKRKQEDKKAANAFLHLGDINERQAEIIKIFHDNPKEVITVKDLQNKFLVTPTTAKNDLIGLMSKNLLIEIPLNKVKKGYIKTEQFDDIIQKVL
ncbi:MAG: Fic family protein [Bacteroidaceae bacterium]|nr:Fic family protein [Bacteroidaceae bacterium]